VTAHGGGGNAQFGAGGGQIAMPGGRLKNDQRIHGRQGSTQSDHIKIIRNPSNISSLEAQLLEYKS
jgi:hypothetical protein